MSALDLSGEVLLRVGRSPFYIVDALDSGDNTSGRKAR